MSCYKCSDNLRGKPKINVEGRVHCYRCAKAEVEVIEKARTNASISEHERRRKVYEQTKSEFNAKHTEWFNRQRAFIEIGSWGCVVGIALAVVLGFIGATFSVLWIVGGVISAFCIYLFTTIYIEDKRRAMFVSENPEPAFLEKEPTYLPPAKVNHYCVEHDGTQLTSRYYQKEILSRDKNTCQWCGKGKYRNNLEVHHIIPRAKGGSDVPTNLITLCKHCHDREGWYGHHRAFPTTIKRSRRRY